MEAAAFEDTHVMQSLSASPNEQEIRNKVSPTPKKEQTEKKGQTEKGASVKEK